MLGDVWLEETKDGKVILCIGIGDGKVERKDITDRFSNDKDKIQTQTNNKG
ncbi:hypothetical protein N9C41_00455 [Candidatus Marinimicrobia bacterium]|jgi:hypothetical protein|nr:hypothetical protein [Candidatus Neomarinimicrobiota bacterium]